MTSLLLGLSTVLAIVPFAPAITGGWTTYLRPLRYADLLARGDTVWCATREAGLLSYSLSGRRFAAITRAPNGLASNELSALAYDRSGRLWVGTNGAGASRMSADGSSWLLVNPFDGLPSDTVNCLEAEGDTMWIGTPRGIAFWNGTQIAGSLPVFGQPPRFGSSNITGVVVRGDTLWLSNDTGVYYSLRSERLDDWTPVVNGLISTQVGALVTNDTLMFCVAGARIHAYVNGGWQIRNAPGNIYRLFDDGGIVTAVGATGLWRMTNGGSTQLATDLTGINTFDPSTIWIPAPVAGGRYVAARASGLIEQPVADQLTGWPEFTPDAPPDNDIRNLNLDGDRVWINTNDDGVGRLIGDSWRIWPPVTSCPGPSCDTSFYNPSFAWALLVDPAGRKWFGCWESAVSELDDSGPIPAFVHHRIDDGLGIPAHTRMWASAADSSGGRWFGADTPNLGVIEPIGLEYYSDSLFAGQPTGFTVYRGNIRSTNTDGALPMNKVHGLTVDKFNNVWIGMTGRGIMTFKVPSDTGFARPFTVPTLNLVPESNSLDVQGLVAYGDTIWALTTHELQRYRRSPLARPVATYNIPETTPLFAANPLAVGPDGSPWVGTEAGMRVFRRDGTSEDFNVRNSPIAGDQIYAIRVHPHTGVVWISTSSGMNRYDPGYRPPPPVQVARLDVTVYPNPISLTRMGVQLRLRGNASAYRGRVLDITGRRIADFDVPAGGRVIWDGKDDEGRMVKPGIYLVHVEAGGRSATARVAVLR